jgi:hypothetical protein
MSLKSRLIPTWPSIGRVKLGQPVLLSYLASEVKSGRKHAEQMKAPARFSSFRELEKGRSVASSKSTAYCSGVSR